MNDNESIKNDIASIKHWMETHDVDEREEWKLNAELRSDLKVLIADAASDRKTLNILNQSINGNGKEGMKAIVQRHDSVLQIITRIAWIAGTVLIVALTTAAITLL